MLKVDEISHVNHSTNFIVDDKIRFTKINKSKVYKRKIHEQWYYKFFDEYLLCDDEKINENIYF